MTEIEKCMHGEWYDCHNPVFIEFKANILFKNKQLDKS
jgi:hypothetical protein